MTPIPMRDVARRSAFVFLVVVGLPVLVMLCAVFGSGCSGPPCVEYRFIPTNSSAVYCPGRRHVFEQRDDGLVICRCPRAGKDGGR